ncbi:MAG TPA: dipeptidase [Chthoniobacterales bacterium]
MSQQQVDQLLEFLRFASISTDPANSDHTHDCAVWLVEKLEAIGLAAKLYPTPGHPVVLAKNVHKPGRKTVLIYGHYDVQPVDPLDLWNSPPFEPVIKNGVIFARGATDNKGQIFSHILGVEEALQKQGGELPVNLIFLIEGEEEIGSPHLGPFIEAHRDELKCDVIAISDTGMIGAGIPTFTYGLRGIAALEFTVTGPSVDLHSGIYGGAVANPLTVVARLLATLHDNEGRVAIPGFYDDVLPLEDWERKLWAQLPITEKSLREVTGVSTLTGEAGYTTLERVWGRPTAEVNGIGGGYQGEGTKTVIPSKGFAKLTFRLVPDQDPGRILQLASEHLKAHLPAGAAIDITLGHDGKAYVVDPNSVYGTAAQRALKSTFNADIALIREGGSIPIVHTFKELLGVETLLLGLALPDCRAHSPNENFPLENFHAGIRLNQALLQELA